MDINQSSALHEANVQFVEELKNLSHRGVNVSFDGKTLPERHWQRQYSYVQDKAADGYALSYMADYITDESGRITEVRLDKVYNKKDKF